AVILVIQSDMHLITVDRYVLADHVDDFLLQLRQVIGLTALATLMGNDDLQALLGHRGRGILFLLAAEVIKKTQRHPPNRRLSSPFFWASRKRWGTSLPSRRSTASL